jgi:hypothetical protein
MATIVIKDLAQSIDLDRKAMLAISGGARVGAGSSFIGNRVARIGRDAVSGLSGFVGRSRPDYALPATLKTLLK